MKLFIDVGNTRVKYAWHNGLGWQHHIALPLTQLLEDKDYPPSLTQVTTIAGVCVAGTAIQRRIERDLQSLFPHINTIRWIKSSSKAEGMCNHYNAQQLGADRWAAAVAAWRKLQSACIVVMAGTATTIDIISDQGEFNGGYILPGFEIMLDSLAQRTQQLPRLDFNETAIDLSNIPQTTEHAILAGCLYAQLGAIERIHHSLGASTTFVVGGGARKFLLKHLPSSVYEDDMLVLEGVRILAAE